MHLYDQLSKLDLGSFPMYGGKIDIALSLNELLKSAVRYRIDNVAQYFWQHERTFWDLADPAHFPSLSPPHPVTWLEYKMPTRYKLESGEVYRPELQNVYAGCLVNTIDRRMESKTTPQVASFFVDMAEDTRWLLRCFIVIGSKNKPPHFSGDGVLLAVAEDGGIGNDKEGNPHYNVFIQSGHTNQEHQDSLTQDSKPALLTFAFLSAKNVIIVDHDPRPKKSSRKRKKSRGYTPYRTLEIEPLRDILRIRNRGASGTGRRLSSVSITRGHFRTYVDDGESKGLFGRGIYGTFWISSHVRGRGSDQDRDREVKI